jgi:hypothetical protein
MVGWLNNELKEFGRKLCLPNLDVVTFAWRGSQAGVRTKIPTENLPDSDLRTLQLDNPRPRQRV